MADKKEEYYVRVGPEFKKLIEEAIELWEEAFGFQISNFDAGELIAKKVNKAGGIKL